MDAKTWTAAVLKVFDFFRMAKLPSDSQIKLWLDNVSHIPGQAVPNILQQLFRDSDTMPRNLPRAFREIYETFPQQERPTFYDPVEDLRFPVALMHRAFDVLLQKGQIAFANYCDLVQMPAADRERVRYKAQVVKNENPHEKVNRLISQVNQNW